MQLFHISDLHFGPHYLPSVGEAVLRLYRSIRPDHVIVTGDLTQRAKVEQYQAARDYLNHFESWPVVIPGNHDIPLYRPFERLFHPYALYQTYIQDELDVVYQTDRLCLVALNSTNAIRNITSGRLSSRQVKLCKQVFRDAPSTALRCIAAHHHFLPAPDYERGKTLPKASTLLEIFSSLNVDLILGGHMHRAYIGNSLDVFPGKHREHGIVIVQAGTATSQRGRAREREKNTLNLIRILERQIEIIHYMYFPQPNEFLPVSQHLFPRAPFRNLDGDYSA